MLITVKASTGVKQVKQINVRNKHKILKIFSLADIYEEMY